MDLINYGYSSDEYSDKEKENGSPAALSNEQIDDDMEVCFRTTFYLILAVLSVSKTNHHYV